jgi:hypothetical protein
MVFKSISEALTVPKIKESSARAKVNKKVLSEKIRFRVVVIEVPHKGVILIYFSIKQNLLSLSKLQDLTVLFKRLYLL